MDEKKIYGERTAAAAADRATERGRDSKKKKKGKKKAQAFECGELVNWKGKVADDTRWEIRDCARGRTVKHAYRRKRRPL